MLLLDLAVQREQAGNTRPSRVVFTVARSTSGGAQRTRLLAAYRHYLSSERRFKLHTLGEAEGWLRHYDDPTSSRHLDNEVAAQAPHSRRLIWLC